jgi:hypothetical protein
VPAASAVRAMRRGARRTVARGREGPMRRSLGPVDVVIDAADSCSVRRSSRPSRVPRGQAGTRARSRSVVASSMTYWRHAEPLGIRMTPLTRSSTAQRLRGCCFRGTDYGLPGDRLGPVFARRRRIRVCSWPPRRRAHSRATSKTSFGWPRVDINEIGPGGMSIVGEAAFKTRELRTPLAACCSAAACSTAGSGRSWFAPDARLPALP